MKRGGLNIRNHKKNELSIAIEDIFAKNHIIYPYFYHSSIYPLEHMYYFSNNQVIPSVSMGYNRSFKMLAVRGKVQIGASNCKTEYNRSNTQLETKIYGYKASLGIIYMRNIQRTQIFFGVNAFLQKNNYKTKTTNIVNDEKQIYNQDNRFASRGASPLLGVKYFITPALSIGTEIQLCAGFFDSKEKYTDKQNEDNNNETKEDGFYTEFSPLGQISINIHF